MEITRALSSASSSPSSALSDIFSTLRWKAAELLTSGLSPEKKALLISKLDVVVPRDQTMAGDQNYSVTDDDTQKTIGEAVAAARMAEAKRQQSKWEAEREFLLKNAEEAARARVESELIVQERRLAMLRWQKELEAENTPTVGGDTTTTTTTTSASADAEAHPTLGPVVADMGYKKIYQVSARTLATIPVWKKQRSYRHDRAKVIAADKMKTLHFGLPGILVLHEVRKFTKYGLVIRVRIFLRSQVLHFACLVDALRIRMASLASWMANIVSAP